MSIVETMFDKCLFAFCNQIKNLIANSNPISITDIRFRNLLPRRFLLKKSLDNVDIDSLDLEVFHNEYKAICDFKKSWVNSCELNLRINNIHSTKSLSILGIYFDYSVIKPEKISSFLEVPQGDYESGEAVCFACCFADDRFTCQRYEILNHDIVLRGDANYFETSTIDISSSRSCNLNLSLISNQQSITINQISVVYRLRGSKATNSRKHLEVPLDNPISIVALKDVPKDQRYRLTWKSNPPVIMLESDDFIFSSCEEKCRWDDYPKKTYH